MLWSRETADLGVNVVAFPAGTALVIPKGEPRSIRCSAGKLVYLTCHRGRERLTPGREGRR